LAHESPEKVTSEPASTLIGIKDVNTSPQSLDLTALLKITKLIDEKISR
jgi:hypothetical protein